MGKVVGTLAQLVEQARVLDGNHSLLGKIVDQLDLLVGKRPHLLAIDGDRAEERTFLEHRHAEGGATAAEIREGDQPRIAFEIWRHGADVVDMHHLFGPANLGLAAFRMNAKWHVLGRGECGRYVVDRGDTGYVSIIQVQY